MKRYRLEGIDRETGKERGRIIDAESEADAIAASNAEGISVARATLIVADVEAAAEQAQEWKPGSSLANTGAFLVFGGVFFVPLAVVGCLMGAAAMELSKGKRGSGVAAIGALIAVLWAVVIGVVMLVNFAGS